MLLLRDLVCDFRHITDQYGNTTIVYGETRSGCFSVGSCIKREKSVLWYQLGDWKTLPTFDWMLQSSSGQKWRTVQHYMSLGVIGGQRSGNKCSSLSVSSSKHYSSLSSWWRRKHSVKTLAGFSNLKAGIRELSFPFVRRKLTSV